MFASAVFVLETVHLTPADLITGVHWSALIPASFLMAAVPGANQILSLRNGMRKGTKVAIIAVTGRFTAFTLMIIAVAFGLSAILQASTVVFNILKWAGVIYLGWLGIKTIVSSRHQYEHDGAASNEQVETSSAWVFAKQELFVAAANPKALLLFTVFLPQFIDVKGGEIGAQILLVGATYIAIEFVCASVYALIGGKLRTIGLSGKVKRQLDRVTGGVMIALAAWLSTERK